MAKLNCWEFKQCGRGPRGSSVDTLGVCPAASTYDVDGINGGKAAGRACWAIAGTLCGGVVQGTFATKLGSCLKCDFYRSVIREEGRAIATAKDIHDRLESGGASSKPRG